MRAAWSLVKYGSRSWVRPVIELRREIGLATGPHPLFEGSHAPDLVLALFSSIFAAPQPDWPKQVRITGFPFYDGPERPSPARWKPFSRQALPRWFLPWGLQPSALPEASILKACKW
jgi:hypothetical protein